VPGLQSFQGEATKQSFIDSDGSLVRYEDPYVVTEEQFIEAVALEEQIIAVRGDIDKHFLVLGRLLDTFDKRSGFLARGYPTFKAWVQSPEIDLSYRTAHDLLRIVREVLPLLGPREAIPSVSKLRELLPLLADDDGQQKFLETFDSTQQATVRDTREAVREARGQSSVAAAFPAIFKAEVTRGDVYHRVRITCLTGVDQYRVGDLLIKPEHWSRWEGRFGEFVEFTDV
jgi:hypothetical protein